MGVKSLASLLLVMRRVCKTPPKKFRRGLFLLFEWRGGQKKRDRYLPSRDSCAVLSSTPCALGDVRFHHCRRERLFYRKGSVLLSVHWPAELSGDSWESQWALTPESGGRGLTVGGMTDGNSGQWGAVRRNPLPLKCCQHRMAHIYLFLLLPTNSNITAVKHFQTWNASVS